MADMLVASGHGLMAVINPRIKAVNAANWEFSKIVCNQVPM
jgi:hypothetical protein